MKIRTLFFLAITIVLGSISAEAQERDGSVTFTDHLKQSITITRFGTVLTFKNSSGRQSAGNHGFRVCPRDGQCTGSVNNSRTKGELSVSFPTQGTTLKQGETLVVTATVRGPELTVTRKLTWVAGSSLVNVEERVSALRGTDITSLTESVAGGLSANPCPPPPPEEAKCPEPRISQGKMTLEKSVRITPAAPLAVNISCDFKQRK